MRIGSLCVDGARRRYGSLRIGRYVFAVIGSLKSIGTHSGIGSLVFFGASLLDRLAPILHGARWEHGLLVLYGANTSANGSLLFHGALGSDGSLWSTRHTRVSRLDHSLTVLSLTLGSLSWRRRSHWQWLALDGSARSCWHGSLASYGTVHSSTARSRTTVHSSPIRLAHHRGARNSIGSLLYSDALSEDGLAHHVRNNFINCGSLTMCAEQRS